MAETNWMAFCFSCGSCIKDGRRYFCVQRLRRIRGDSDFNEDIILDGMASLQICAPCITKAATREVTFQGAPVPMLNLEKEAVRELAQSIVAGYPMKEQVIESEDSCSFCHTAIGRGATYTKIEIMGDMQEGSLCEEESLAELAIICEDCAMKYMVWL